MEVIKYHKVELIKWLRWDSLILQHVQSRNLITTDEYTTVKSIQDPTEKITKLLDIMYQKGPFSCQMFLELLKRDDVNESNPELRQWIARVNFSGQPDDSTNTAARNEDVHRQTESEMLKSVIRDRYAMLYEGTAAKGKHRRFSEIYTELCVVEDWRGGVNMDHEVIQTEAGFSRRAVSETTIKFSEVFSGSHVKKVLTLGIAGIGKTVSAQKFALDWAEGKSNVDIDFVFFIPFRELNLLKDEEYSLHELLLCLYPELKNLKETGLFDGKCKCVFIFDGLDELRKTLDFKQKNMLAVNQKAPVDVLVRNLIAGALFRSALVWITSRPAAADQIPSDCIHLVTEVQGFVTGRQKEEYFRKRISDEDLASRIISHIKQSKTLYIMCHIPVFCWITCVVLQEIMGKCNVNVKPTTLTQLYAHFLTVQMDRKSKKYVTYQKDSKKLFESDQTMLLKLAELAFKQLMEGNVMFSEEDLKESGIDVTQASVYSGIFTGIFREESIFFQRKAYCFVHASFQEFLAAVYVFHCYMIRNLEVLDFFTRHKLSLSGYRSSVPLSVDDLLIGAVDKAMKSQDGHLDLFLRFLLGISLESNQRLLQGLLSHTRSRTELVIRHIKRILQTNTFDFEMPVSAERYVNLFLCLSEMKAQSLSREIEEYLKSEKHSEKTLSPGQCSALACLLLISEDVLPELHLKKYKTSEEGYRRLLPAVSACKKAILDHCNLTVSSCETLCTALKSVNCPLKLLYLSYNDLQDSGVELLSAGLKSSHCKLEFLSLSSCNLGKMACEYLGSALQSVNSSLKELDLSNNDLQDSGVEVLSAGLKSSHCKLEFLSLSGCMVTEKGCSSLASALNSTHSYLKKLDLTYNHPGESGVQLLSNLQKDPHCRLAELQVGYGGTIRMKPGIKKYTCDLTLDPDTAHRFLLLSEGNRKVEHVCEEQPYLDHAERFDSCLQVLSVESLTGRCYWEAEWSGEVAMSVSYRWIRRRGDQKDCRFGYNNQSWSLICSDHRYTVRHNGEEPVLFSAPSSHRVGVYLDRAAETLSFYSASPTSQTLTHLHTFTTRFIGYLYAGFWVDPDSSVCLCDLE